MGLCRGELHYYFPTQIFRPCAIPDKHIFLNTCFIPSIFLDNQFSILDSISKCKENSILESIYSIIHRFSKPKKLLIFFLVEIFDHKDIKPTITYYTYQDFHHCNMYLRPTYAYILYFNKTQSLCLLL